MFDNSMGEQDKTLLKVGDTILIANLDMAAGVEWVKVDQEYLDKLEGKSK